MKGRTKCLLALAAGTLFSGHLLAMPNGIVPGSGWADSYSADGRCYIDSNFDHGIGDAIVPTPIGGQSVRQVADRLGVGPGRSGNPIYNDVQCGNGPANNAGDEDPDQCPGRVDMGSEGCFIIGPKWDLAAAYKQGEAVATNMDSTVDPLTSLDAMELTSTAQSPTNTVEIISGVGTEPCFAWGDKLKAARVAFASICPLASVRDCDPVDGKWVCASAKVETLNSELLRTAVFEPGNAADNEIVNVESDGTQAALSDVCYAKSSDYEAAKIAYADMCTAARVDCDPVNGEWICASKKVETIDLSTISTPATNTTANEEMVSAESPAQEPNAERTELVASQELNPAPSESQQNTDTDSTDGKVDAINIDVSFPIDHTYPKNDGPFKNPLKGWNSGWDGDNDHPESSVGFQYIPWKDFEPVDNNFDFAAVEDRIDNEGSKNRHLILRLYCDWHGDDYESDCPPWMYTSAGVARLQGDNGRFITDFNDPAYLVQATEAIEALASRYDADPRMYSFQMGVIGYWGEWHSYASSFNGEGYNITDETKLAILNAYQSSFSNAKIMARYPWREPAQSATGVGFHNDYFVVNNGHSDEFDAAIANSSQWVSNPIGGEVPPRSSGDVANEAADLFAGDAGNRMIETGHYSTMKAGAYRIEQGENYYEGYMRLHKKMGYNYQIDVARFADTISRAGQLDVELFGSNIGVAPMYFNWDVQIALLDGAELPVVVTSVDGDLTSILPGSSFNFAKSIDTSSVDSGSYRLAVRIIQPGADKAKQQSWKLDARNTYILFSNDLPVVEGAWESNQLIGGWSVLGNITIN